MRANNLPKLTPEERLEMQEKAKATREAKRLAGESLKQDFGSDETKWREMASEIGFRMPSSYIPASETKHLKKLLKLCKIDPKQWLEVEGLKTLKSFSVLNPEYPAYSHCGLFLEWYFEEVRNV